VKDVVRYLSRLKDVPGKTGKKARKKRERIPVEAEARKVWEATKTAP